MGNDVAVINDGRNQKDCCANNQENGISLLSIVESAGKSAAGAIHKAENFGAGVAAGAASALGLHMSKETAESVGKAAVAVGIGGIAGLAAEQVLKNPGAAAAVGAGVAGAVGAELLKGAATDVGKAVAGGAAACAAECAKDAGSVVKDAAKDAAIGAIVGGAAGAASGDATRAVALAAVGAIAGAAARCAAEMSKPCCCIKPSSPADALKDLGKTTLDHIKNRPIEAGAEAVIGGVPGVVGGAMLHKMLDQKNCEKLCDKVLKNTCTEIQKQAELLKKILVDPITKPVIEMGPGPVGNKGGADAGAAVKAAAEAAAIIAAPGVAVGVEAGKAAAQAVKQSNLELEQHRKDNPTTSAVERGIGYAAGGPIAGKAVGTVIELGDVKARQAYGWVKSWFE